MRLALAFAALGTLLLSATEAAAQPAANASENFLAEHALLVADDTDGTIWRISYSGAR